MKLTNQIFYLKHSYPTEWKWNPYFLNRMLGKSNIDSDVEDLVKMAPTCAEQVSNNNWRVHYQQQTS